MKKKRQHSVFFVDNEPQIREIITTDLKTLGCNVTPVASAEDCLKQVPNQKCHLLITDVNMPGMNGLALLNKIQHIAPWIPVMIISGYGDVPMSVKAIKQGAVDFLEKPLNRYGFLQKVK